MTATISFATSVILERKLGFIVDSVADAAGLGASMDRRDVQNGAV